MLQELFATHELSDSSNKGNHLPQHLRVEASGFIGKLSDPLRGTVYHNFNPTQYALILRELSDLPVGGTTIAKTYKELCNLLSDPVLRHYESNP